MTNRSDHSHLLQLLSTQRRNLTITHRRLMSRGCCTLPVPNNCLEASLERGNSPAVMDLVLESGLNRVEAGAQCAFIGLFRWKKTRSRLSESVPKRSVQSQARCYRRSTTLKREKALPLTRGKWGQREEFLRKEELYGRLEALGTSNRTSVLDSISWTSSRLQATNTSLR